MKRDGYTIPCGLAVYEFVVFHPFKALATLVVGVLLGVGSFYGYQLVRTLDAVATESFDPARARAAMGAEPLSDATRATFVEPDVFELDPGVYETPDLEAEVGALIEILDLFEPFNPREVSPFSFSDPIPDVVFDTYLLLGTDESGLRADAIILGLQPTDGGRPIMVSLPRDLYVWNACKQTLTRLSAGLGGCSGVASGSEMMAILVEDYTGIPVDHLARVDFDGFAAVVDALGGTTICVDYPTRDPNSGLDIASAGCHFADGSKTLAWVRSRHTEQLIDGAWSVVTSSDFARQRRQRDVLFQLAARATGFPSPPSLMSQLDAVAGAVRLDSSWTFGQAVSAAWQYRGISRSSVDVFSISVKDYRTPGGAAVLLPTESFRSLLGAVYPLG